MKGTIKRVFLDKDHGFITADGVDYFFHKSALQNVKIEELRFGQEVTFEDSEGLKGPRAENVTV